MKPTQVTIEGSQEVELNEKVYEVEFKATAHMTYVPGRTVGPPESCYPDERECEIIDLHIVCAWDEDGNDVSSRKYKSLTEELDKDEVEEALWEAFHEDWEDTPE